METTSGSSSSALGYASKDFPAGITPSESSDKRRPWQDRLSSSPCRPLRHQCHQGTASGHSWAKCRVCALQRSMFPWPWPIGAQSPCILGPLALSRRITAADRVFLWRLLTYLHTSFLEAWTSSISVYLSLVDLSFDSSLNWPSRDASCLKQPSFWYEHDWLWTN